MLSTFFDGLSQSLVGLLLRVAESVAGVTRLAEDLLEQLVSPRKVPPHRIGSES